MPAVVQIVSAVGSGGTVLLDLNYGTTLLGQRDDVKLADVELAKLDRQVQWTGATPSQAPDDLVSRTITVPIVALTASPDAAGAFASTLHQLVSVPFVLKVQRHAASSPVWLRCWPCAPKLTTQIAAAGMPTSIVTGSLTTSTEPYAIGARVDAGPFTVTQNPASGTPFAVDITGVTGDSLTPVVLRFTADDVANAEDQIHVSTRRRGTPSNLAPSALVVQAESGTASVISGGTPAPTVATFSADGTFSNSSGVRGTFPAGALGGTGYPGFQVVVTPSLSGVEAPGTYRILARVRRSGGAAGQYFALHAVCGPATNREAFLAGGNDTRIVDLGLVQVPIGQPAFMAAPEGPVSAQAAAVTLKVFKTWAGAGVVDIDWIGLVPADQDAGVLSVNAPLPGTGKTVAVDGYDHGARVYSVDPYGGGSPVAQGSTAVTWLGGVPRLRPGANRLFVVAGLGATAASSRSPSSTITLSASYWPRYRWLA